MAEDDPEAAIAIARTRDGIRSRGIIETAVAVSPRIHRQGDATSRGIRIRYSMAAVARIVAAREPVEAFDFCRDGRGNSISIPSTTANEVPRTGRRAFPHARETRSGHRHHTREGRRPPPSNDGRSDPVEAIQWVEKNWPDAPDTALLKEIKFSLRRPPPNRRSPFMRWPINS